MPDDTVCRLMPDLAVVCVISSLNDMRCDSDEQTKTNVEAIIGQLAEDK